MLGLFFSSKVYRHLSCVLISCVPLPVSSFIACYHPASLSQTFLPSLIALVFSFLPVSFTRPLSFPSYTSKCLTSSDIPRLPSPNICLNFSSNSHSTWFFLAFISILHLSSVFVSCVPLSAWSPPSLYPTKNLN